MGEGDLYMGEGDLYMGKRNLYTGGALLSGIKQVTYIYMGRGSYTGCYNTTPSGYLTQHRQEFTEYPISLPK